MPFYFILFPSCIVFLCPMYFVIMSNKQFWSWSWLWINEVLWCSPECKISGKTQEIVQQQVQSGFQIISLWGTSDFILQHRTRSTFANIMIQCWLLINEILCSSPECNFTVKTQEIILYEFENFDFKLLPRLPGIISFFTVMLWFDVWSRHNDQCYNPILE